MAAGSTLMVKGTLCFLILRFDKLDSDSLFATLSEFQMKFLVDRQNIQTNEWKCIGQYFFDLSVSLSMGL